MVPTNPWVWASILATLGYYAWRAAQQAGHI